MTFATKNPIELEAMFGQLALATVVVHRDADSQWRITWQNSAAQAIWGAYELDEDGLLKLELLDAASQVTSTTFVHTLLSRIESYRFTATPTPNGDALLLNFLEEPVSTQRSADALNTPGDLKDAISNAGSIYQLVTQAADFGVFDWNIEQDTIQFSQKSYQILDLPSNMLGRNRQAFFSHVHPDDVLAVEEALEAHLETQWPLKVEFRVVNQKGQNVWIEATGQAVWDSVSGVAVRLAGTLNDVSDRKRAEQQLQQRERLIEQIIDALPISIYVKDAQGCFRFFNKQAELNTAVSRSKAIGRTDFEVFAIEEAMIQVKRDAEVKQLGKAEISEEAFTHNGQTTWQMIGRSPMQVEQPEARFETWMIGFALDMTERKQMEDDLKAAKQAAEAATKAKSDFLSVMSHEIRTPLNAVIGNSVMLLDAGLPVEQGQHVEMIKRAGDHLLYLINDILDFNKLEAGKVELENRLFEIEKQVKTVVEMSITNAKMKDLSLDYKIEEGVASFYKGDEGRLRQILLNLVGNAIKFTKQGGVSVRVSLAKEGANEEVNEGVNEGSKWVRFEVTDTGIGIPKESIHKLFTEFTQVDASTTRQFGGTGLGLSICKKLVEAMGGQIGIESVEGEGTTFWFEIPFELPTKQEVAHETHSEKIGVQRPLKILVAEDNLANQMLIKAILKKQGHHVVIANDGLEAFEIIQSETACFDLILMDMQMPRMDGLQATQQIRLLESCSANIPIIALTANAVGDEYETVIAAGMNDFLTKPINIEALKKALFNWSSPSD